MVVFGISGLISALILCSARVKVDSTIVVTKKGSSSNDISNSNININTNNSSNSNNK